MNTGFSWLDWTILVVGILAIVWAVYRSIKKDKEKMAGADSQDYLFGKGEPWYIIGAAIFAANIGSEHLVGLAGTGAKDGVGMAHWEMQGWMILILGWLFVPFYQLLNNKMGKIITMPDFLKFRYTNRTGSWLSIITLIAYVFTKVSVTAFTGGIFFEFLLGIPFWYGALGLIFITAIFTVFGGMKGVMTLSAIQTPILIIGSFLVFFLGLAYLGGGNIADGWTAMMTNAQQMHEGFGINHMFHFGEKSATGVTDPLYKEYPGYVVFIGASIIGFWYWCTDQHIVQRVLGQRKGEDNAVVMKRARRGSIAAGYFKLLPCFMFLIPGMIAIALNNGYIHDFTLLDPETFTKALTEAKNVFATNPEQLEHITAVVNSIDPALMTNAELLKDPTWIEAHKEALNAAMINTDATKFLLNTDASFAVMVKTVLPMGVKGIVTIGFICALVASLAAFFNSCATLFTEDFYKPMKKGKSEAHYVLVGRIATVVVVLLGLAWMPVMMSMDTLYSYLQNIQSLLAPAMVAVFTLGIFSKKITPKAGEWGLIGGFLVGMLRLITNVITNNGNAKMTGAFWQNTEWFWQTNWLIFECWLLVFIIALMVVVSFFTKAPSKAQIEAITFTGEYRKQIRESWGFWDIVATLGVIALCACFYLYFW